MKLKMMLLLVLASIFLLASLVQAEKLLCVSSQTLKGEQTVNSCLAKGERFGIVDQYGLVRILTPEEVELTRAFNPKAFDARAYGVTYFKEAPYIPPLPVSPEQ